MKGVQFVTDDHGERVAVQLDLKEWGELWEDIYDTMIALDRKSDPTMLLDQFEAELQSEGLMS